MVTDQLRGAAHDHVVQFYAHDAALARTVGEYLAAGLRAGEVVLVIATEPHRAALEAELGRRGVDVLAARADGALAMLDAAGILAQVMVEGHPDRDRFDHVIGSLVRDALDRGREVRAFGEMVALLWDQGLIQLAIELEDLWNELGHAVPFGLFCAYPSASVSSADDAEAFEQVCRAHSAVIDSSAVRFPLPDTGEPVEVVKAFPATIEAPTEAREFVTGVVREFSDGAVPDEAAWVAAELTTNAVVHAGSAFTVTVSRRDGRLRISVWDTSTRAPRLRAPKPFSTAGRGLQIVNGLATRWGTELLPDGKIVWAELAAPVTVER